VFSSVPSPPGCLRATSEFLFLAKLGASADEAGGSSAGKGITMATFDQAVGTGVRNVRALTRDSLHPISQWAALEGCTVALLMAEHDDTKQTTGQCARACGALTRVRSACLWCAQRACATPLPQGGAKARSSARGQRGVDDRARRRKAGKRAARVSLWRADACAQGVPVARTACVRYASFSGRGQNKEQRAWTA